MSQVGRNFPGTIPLIKKYVETKGGDEKSYAHYFTRTKEKELSTEEILAKHKEALVRYREKYGDVKIYHEDKPSQEVSTLSDIVIETSDLAIRPITNLDQKVEGGILGNILYEGIYNDPAVMKLFGNGSTYTSEVAQKLMTLHAARWGDNYPLAGMVVEEKESGNVCGIVAPFTGQEARSAEIVGLGMTAYQKRGYGAQACGAVVLEYFEQLYQSEFNKECGVTYKLTNDVITKDTSETAPIFRAIATARDDNRPSLSCLEHYGFTKYGTNDRDGLRWHLEKILVGEPLSGSYNTEVFGDQHDYYSDAAELG